MTTTLQSISASASPEVQMNENAYDVAPAGFLGRDFQTSTGLIWGFLGGTFFNGSSMGVSRTTSTVALTGSATNFVEMTNTGSVFATSSAFTAGRRPMYEAVCNATGPQSIVDH